MGGQVVPEGTKMSSENSEFQATVCASGREEQEYVNQTG